MRALFVAILCSFQLAACVTGDNTTEPDPETLETDGDTVITDTEDLAPAEPSGAMEVSDALLDLAQQHQLELDAQPRKPKAHKVPRQTMLEEVER